MNPLPTWRWSILPTLANPLPIPRAYSPCQALHHYVPFSRPSVFVSFCAATCALPPNPIRAPRNGSRQHAFVNVTHLQQTPSIISPKYKNYDFILYQKNSPSINLNVYKKGNHPNAAKIRKWCKTHIHTYLMRTLQSSQSNSMYFVTPHLSVSPSLGKSRDTKLRKMLNNSRDSCHRPGPSQSEYLREFIY